MGIGPVPAVRKLLDRTGLAIGDVDLVELNEAFASQSVAVARELGIDEERLNVNGGAIAIGHPLGMSGARLTVSLLHELRRRNGRRGIVDDVRRRRPGTGGTIELSAAENYVLLGLRLGRHIDGLVDSYYGPAELKEQADSEELVAPAQLADDAAELHDSLDDGYLRDQVHGCWTCARVLAGEQLSYSDEVEGSYGVRPERTPETVFERVHAELDELLPGDGPLDERRRAWRDRHVCPGDKAVEVLRELLPLLRARTLEVVDLPEGESPGSSPCGTSRGGPSTTTSAT